MTAPSFSRPVAVTGASGYIGSWVVRELLAHGATVHATVRDPSRADRVAHLHRAAEGLPGRLELFAADLLQPASFDAAFAGCGVVLHTASPFVLTAKDPERELIAPARDGTRAVLAAVDRTPTVERVVLTSSIAAVIGDNADAPGGVADETMWNTTSSADHNPYFFSKTVAEREAWRLAEAQSRWRLVVVNPAFVMGPSLSTRTDSTSVDFLVTLLDGTRRAGMPRVWNGFVDVRDVAAAHVAAALRPDAEGRHILCRETAHYADIAARLRAMYPDRPLPTRAVPDWLTWIIGPIAVGWSWRFIRRNVGIPVRYDARRSVERLGVRYRALDETFRDHAEQLVRDGLLR